MKYWFDHLVTFVMLLFSFRIPRERIRAFQKKRLKVLLNHAYLNLPYYRDLFDDNRITPSQINGMAGLARIPISEKSDLRSVSRQNLMAKKVSSKRIITHRTSGSTGEPFTMIITRLESWLANMMRFQIRRYCGRRIRDKKVTLTYWHGDSQGRKALYRRILEALGVCRSRIVDCNLPPIEIYEVLQGYKPRWLEGSPGTIASLANWLLENKRSMGRLNGIEVRGEVLTEKMRKRIGRAFRAPVFDRYDCHELGPIGWQCLKSGNLHIFDANVIVEIIKDNGEPALPGEKGELVGTCLSRFAMPFIRYRLGDIVTKGEEVCPCGKPFLTLREVQGRRIDTFVLPDGRFFHPFQIMANILVPTDWICQYALIQESLDRIVLKIVPFCQPPRKEIERIRRESLSLLGAKIEFKVVLVSEIEKRPGDKFYVSRSLVPRYGDRI